MVEEIKNFIATHLEYTDNTLAEYGENSIEYITAQYAADILLQLADDLGLEVD